MVVSLVAYMLATIKDTLVLRCPEACSQQLRRQVCKQKSLIIADQAFCQSWSKLERAKRFKLSTLTLASIFSKVELFGFGC
jgi:hypothetical protein